MPFWKRQAKPQQASQDLRNAIVAVAREMFSAAPADFSVAHYTITQNGPQSFDGKFVAETPQGPESLRLPNAGALVAMNAQAPTRGEHPWTKLVIIVNSDRSFDTNFSYDAPDTSSDRVENRNLDQIEARNNAWSKIGVVAPDVYAPLINPAFSGGPRWPDLRQSYLGVKRTNGYAILASDGLSDRFDSNIPGLARRAGFGLELYIQTPPKTPTRPGAWPLKVLNAMAQNAADMGDLIERIAQHQFLSTELFVKDAPGDWLIDGERIGVLLGLPSASIPAEIDTPAGQVRLISLQVLRPAESDACRTGKRTEVAERLASLSQEPVSALDRQSVL
jgi:hypothetical protein